MKILCINDTETKCYLPALLIRNEINMNSVSTVAVASTKLQDESNCSKLVADEHKTDDAVTADTIDDEKSTESAIESEASSVDSDVISENTDEPVSASAGMECDVITVADISISSVLNEYETVEAIPRDDSEDQIQIVDDDNTDNSEEFSNDTAICDEENSSYSESAMDSEVAVSSIFREDIYEEQYGDMVAPHIEKMPTNKRKNSAVSKTSPNKKTEVKEKPINSDSTLSSSTSSIIDQHFGKNGYIIVDSSTSQTIAGLKSLTYLIGENFSLTAPFLKAARKAICAPNAKGERILYFTIEKDVSAFFHQFAGTLKQYGVLTKYFINGNALTATISSVPRVINYLTGQWLEMYSAYILEDVISEYAKAHGYKYEILMNVKVSSIKSCGVYAHELDCVISVDDKCFAFEMKSGQFDDYFNLYNTRKELHFVPDRYLLLSTGLDEEVASTLQYFYEFYITGMGGFKSRLKEMIDKAFIN